MAGRHGETMATTCRCCGSKNLEELASEINIHFPWQEGATRDPVFAFPRIVVCLDCGFLESRLSESDVSLLREGEPEFKSVAR